MLRRRKKKQRREIGSSDLKFKFYNIWGKTRKKWGRDPREYLGRRDPGRGSSKGKGPKTEARLWYRKEQKGNQRGRSEWGKGMVLGKAARARSCRTLYIIVKSSTFPLSKPRVLSKCDTIFKWSFLNGCTERELSRARASAGDQLG